MVYVLYDNFEPGYSFPALLDGVFFLAEVKTKMISWHANLFSCSTKLFMQCTIQGVLPKVQSVPVRDIDFHS